jgi:hypothetical protein
MEKSLMKHALEDRPKDEKWKPIASELKKIRVCTHPDNRRVSVGELPPGFVLVGRGTDAAVVSHADWPGVVFKVYGADRLYKKQDEAAVYRRLGESPHFCRYLGQGDGFLVLSHEQGPTLYECLEKGIAIPPQAVEDVERIREYVRSVGLNPKGIHLRNVLLVNGRAKMVDVAEFLKPGNDRRWELLARGYRTLYPLIRGRKVPAWLLNLFKETYRLFVR